MKKKKDILKLKKFYMLFDISRGRRNMKKDEEKKKKTGKEKIFDFENAFTVSNFRKKKKEDGEDKEDKDKKRKRRMKRRKETERKRK